MENQIRMLLPPHHQPNTKENNRIISQQKKNSHKNKEVNLSSIPFYSTKLPFPYGYSIYLFLMLAQDIHCGPKSYKLKLLEKLVI